MYSLLPSRGAAGTARGQVPGRAPYSAWARAARVAGALRALLAPAQTGRRLDGDTRSYVIAADVA